MAGMLPGVEAARRRRFHNNKGDNNNEARRRPSSFCLYAANTNPTFREKESRKRCCDERLEQRLGAAATDAKKRLDHRLLGSENNESDLGNLKRSGSKRLIGWWKLLIIRWRSRWWGEEEEECAVCLEGLHHNKHLRRRRGGEIVIMELPCAHRFHTNCLLPWLQAQPHCPCCRLQLPSS